MHSIQGAIEQIKSGGMIIVVDDENRENEGDLVCAASTATADQINFMAKYGRGLICLALPPTQIEKLNLPLMKRMSGDTFSTAFTYSIDAKENITTGISAAERAYTIRLAVSSNVLATDFVSPGHIFPLQARPGGVLERPGHTEAAVDLTRMAGLEAGGVICEIMNDDGTMMRLPDLQVFAKDHDLPLISIQDLIQFRQEQEIKMIAETILPTKWGSFKSRIYHDAEKKEHLVLWLGDIEKQKQPLVRIHSECMTGDIFSSLRCDCGEQLEQALQEISTEGAGVIIYLRQEGRGIGLTEKIKAYALQQEGLDTVEANLALGHSIDSRSYEVAVKVLDDLEISHLRLLTNNPDKVSYLESQHKNVVRIPLIIPTCQHNAKYQQTKVQKLNHLIHNHSIAETKHVSTN